MRENVAESVTYYYHIPYTLNCKIAAKAQLLKIDMIDQDFG